MKIRSEKKNGVVLSYISMMIEVLVSLVYTPVMLRLLGQSNYGVYQAAASVISYMTLFSLGFNSAYMRFYARYKVKEDQDGIQRLNFLFFTVFSIAGLLSLVSGCVLATQPALVFGNKFTGAELRTSSILLVIMAINMAITFFSTIFSMYVDAQEKFTFEKIVSICSTVLKPTVTLPLLLLGYGSVGMTVATTVVTIGVTIANFRCATRCGMKFRFGKIDKSLLREVLVFSVFIFITSVAGVINATIDTLLLSHFEGPKAVAIYEIGSKFNSYFMFFSLSVTGVFIPKVNMMVANEESNGGLTDLLIRIGRFQFMLMAFILGGFTLLGKFFIGIYAGAGYEESYRIAMWIMFGSFIPYTQNIGIEIQKAKNKHIFRSLAFLGIALANIAFSIPFIRAFGISGAAAGTALSLLLGNTILMNFYYKFGIGLEMGRFWKSMVKPALAFLAPMVPCGAYVILRGVNSIVEFLVVGVVYSLLFIAGEWLLAMNEYEKGTIKSFLHFKT